jgi:hypothetical protein
MSRPRPGSVTDDGPGLIAALTSRAVGPVLGFTLAYMAVAFVASLRGRNSEFLPYLVVIAALLAVVAVVLPAVAATIDPGPNAGPWRPAPRSDQRGPGIGPYQVVKAN